jgi:tRNA nucleotidyltransferase (CCA-adding enzyme)
LAVGVLPATSQVYLVGGAVRDRLLGIEGADKDYVVVGSNPEQMLAAGFVPVGKDFPVFIHPRDNCEYALARTERKLAKGYHGFSFQADAAVTLEQDLMRRDLTINAIAQDASGLLIDPYGGQADIEARVLRHVSESFVEDPVRILRTARLMARLVARYPDFTVAPETLSLMKLMVQQGEVDALVPERVWKEISRGLIEPQPSHMFDLLKQSDALERLCPELDWTDSLAHAVDSVQSTDQLPIRFAVLSLGFNSLEMVNQRWRVPNECADLAVLVTREREAFLALAKRFSDCDHDDSKVRDVSGETVVSLLERSDAFRKPIRFEQALVALNGFYDSLFAKPVGQRLVSLQKVAMQVNAGEIAMAIQQDLKLTVTSIPLEKSIPEQIKSSVHQARVNAVVHAVFHSLA